MDFSRYITFTYDDFLNDDFFVGHIVNPSADKTKFWELYLEHHPEKKSAITAARQFIIAYRKQDVHTNEVHTDRVWEKITRTIQMEAQPAKKNFKLYSFLRIAAVLFIATSLGLGYWWTQKDIEITTAFGEIKTVVLPDHSTLILNGNSSVTYARNWDGIKREVWIKGEGFFKVQHLNRDTLHILQNEKFVVHTDELDIEVLGTSFNVRNRHHQSKVGLLTGKIKISYAGDVKKQRPSLIMAPGDYAVQHADQQVKVKKLTNPELLITWTKHQLVFKDATLEEIAQTLQDDFGYKVELDQSISAKQKIEGEINVTTVDELLGIISNTLHIDITKNDKTIKITPQ